MIKAHKTFDYHTKSDIFEDVKITCWFYMDINKKNQNETIVNGSRIYIDDGKVKTILSSEIEQSGYMSVDEMYKLIDANVRKIYEMNDGLSS